MGYLARRMHQVTTLGMLLSPLADKLLVATAYIALVRFAPALVSGWIAVLIVGREFLVTGLRSVAVQEGMKLDVRDIGKVKTVVQVVSVVAVLMAHAWTTWPVGGDDAARRDDRYRCDLADAGGVAALGFGLLPRFLGRGLGAEQRAPQAAAICRSAGRAIRTRALRLDTTALRYVCGRYGQRLLF